MSTLAPAATATAVPTHATAMATPATSGPQGRGRLTQREAKTTTTAAPTLMSLETQEDNHHLWPPMHSNSHTGRMADSLTLLPQGRHRGKATSPRLVHEK